MDETEDDGLLTASEAARLLGVHAATLRRWDADGALPAVRESPSAPPRYRPQDVASYLRARRPTATLQDQIAQAALLQDVGQAVTSSLDLPAIYRSIYDSVCAVMAADTFYIALFTDQGALDVQFLARDGREVVPALDLLAAPAARRAAAQGETCWGPAADDDEAGCAWARAGDDIAALIVAPLYEGEGVVGLISAQTTAPAAYSPGHVETLERVAERVMPAIRNARLYARAIEEEARYRTLLEVATDAVLVADKEGRFVDVNEAACELLGYSRAELLTLTVADLQPEDSRADALQRYREGLGTPRERFERRLARKDGETVLVEMRTTTLRVHGQLLSQAICRDLSDRQALEAARSREHSIYLASVRSLAATVDARDAYTHSHSQQVAFYSRLIAEELGLPPSEVETIELAGLLHDIGKIAIPDTILQKPGRLTPEEWAVMRSHASKGADILSAGDNPALAAIAPMVRYHHERWGGGGYPEGLAGAQIPRGATVIAVADAFDTITTARPYKPASSLREAWIELERSRGGHLCPEVTDAFLRVIARDRAAGADYLEAVARGAEPSASALPRVAAVGPLTDTPVGPQSLTYQEQQRLAAHMQSLYAIAQGFRGVKDEPGVVDAAARLAQDHFGAERVLLLELRDAAGQPVRPQPGAPVSTAQVAARWGWEDGADFAPFTSFVTGRAVGWENVLTAAEPLAIPDMRAALPAEFLPPLRMEIWRSAVFIPLRAGGEWLGALGIGYHSGYHTFTADDLELAETLGAEAARALAGQRLQDAELQLRRQLAALEQSHAVLARRGRDLSAINQTAQALATLSDEDTLCARVVDVLAANFGYTSALIGLISGDRLLLRAMRGFEGSALTPAWPLDSGVIGRVARTGQPALVTDVTQDPDYVRVRAGTHSEICVPLVGRAGVLGVVDIESSGPQPLGAEDLELLLTLAPQIVIALENARLYGEAQQQARRLALITRVAHFMTSMVAGEPGSLLEEATALLQQELGYSNVSVMLREPGSGVLVCGASAGAYTGFIGPGYRQEPGVGLLGWVARHGRTLVVNDVPAEPRFYQADPAETPGAEAVVPLIHHGALVGLLDVESATPHRFAPTDVQMLETLADQLAVALAQAEQVEALRRAAGRAARRRSA